jgi:hypothetical protein
MIDLLERDSELAEITALVRRGGVLSIEAGAGVGKTSMIEAACAIARRGRCVVLRARGSDLERDFPFGVTRQLFERCFAEATAKEREALLAGPAGPVALLFQRPESSIGEDTGFAVLHGLYWLTVHLADEAPLLLAVDDAHWADQASLRWLAYLAPRLEGPSVSLVVTLRPDEPASGLAPLLALRGLATTIRPSLLSGEAVATIVRNALGPGAGDELVALAYRATGGNPFYLGELLRAVERTRKLAEVRVLEDVVCLGGVDAVALRLRARLESLDPAALRLAQALAILGDGCELRHAAVIANFAMARATRLTTELVKLEVLSADNPPLFLHPIVRHAVAQTLSSAEKDAAQRAAARVLHADGLPAGRVAAHLAPLRGSGDAWVVERLRAAARAAIHSGAPAAAADLIERALSEPPLARVRVDVLREASRAYQLAGREGACQRLQEALALTRGKARRAQLAAELAHAHAAFFHWVDAVEVLENALPDARGATRTRLEAELVAVGLQDARTARRALRVIERLSRRRLSGFPATALGVARGMVAILTGRSADEAARPLQLALEAATANEESWDMRAAVLWGLVTAEQFAAVETMLKPLREQADRSGSSR